MLQYLKGKTGHAVEEYRHSYLLLVFPHVVTCVWLVICFLGGKTNLQVQSLGWGTQSDGFTIPKVNGIDKNVFQIVKQTAENICSGWENYIMEPFI